MTAEKERRRKRAITGFKYQLEGLDYTNSGEQVDRNTKGQYAKAAEILLKEYTEREATRNMPGVVTIYNNNKVRYTGADPFTHGRDGLDQTAPSDWPLNQDQWTLATNNPPYSLLDVAMGYLIYEKERLARQHNRFSSYGANALDEVQVKRLEKTEQRRQNLARANWRRRFKAGPEVIHDAPNSLVCNGTVTSLPMPPPATPYVSSQDPFAYQALDNYVNADMNFFDD